MKKLSKIIPVFLSASIMLTIVPVTIASAGSDTLTLDNAVNSAIEYSLLDEKQKLLQKDWDSELEKAKGQVNGLEELAKLDNKIKNYKKYVDEEDYRSMRIDIDREDSADFLLDYGYISYIDYLSIKGGLTEDDLPIMYIFNDDQVLKKYYEFQLRYLPEAMAEEDRIDMLTARDTSLGQVTAAIKREKTELEKEKEKLRMDVVKSYTDLIIAGKSLDNALNNQAETQKIVERYEKLYKSGLVTLIEYDQAKVELSKKTNEVKKANMQYDKYVTVLNVLMGKNESAPITVDDSLKLTDNIDLSYNKLQDELEKENINLFMLRETSIIPAEARYKTACEELKTSDKLYKDIKDEKDKAEMEYAQTLSSYKSAILQQLRGIRSTQSGSLELQRNIDLLDQSIALTAANVKAGLATELDLLKLQNSKNTLVTNKENLGYTLDYQIKNLEYTTHY